MLIRAEEVKNGGKVLCEGSGCIAVKKGHAVCGDSAFMLFLGGFVAMGVLDGVSGESFASSASSQAAKALADYFTENPYLSKNNIKDAFDYAHNSIKNGYTTASVFCVKDGRYVAAAVGDSPVYLIEENAVRFLVGKGRIVGKGDSLFKFLSFRNVVSSVLGGESFSLEIEDGKVKEGSILLAVSDGIADNLKILLKDGYVADESGTGDIKEIIDRSSPRSFLEALILEVEGRWHKGRLEGNGWVIIPKPDDISAAVFFV